MMIRNRILLKAIAVFLILEVLFNTVAPTFSWALTAGPTAPEATSFEPVDTTDMIDLSSGDFVYNMSLLEVPGPSGGYPVSLAYHAGIQPGEEASWVGLGWTLNTGAITRNVNGFPDDHKNVNTTDRVFWSGGQTDTYSLGVSIGLKGGASVGVNLAYSQDTYRGVGVGVQLEGTFASQYSASIGVSPYGKPTAGVGAGGVGISTDFNSVTLSAGMGPASVNFNLSSNSLSVTANMDVTLGTNKRGRSLKVGGGPVSVFNSRRSTISTETGGFGVSIPIYAVTISLGYNYQRYWIDATEKVSTNGSLYNPNAKVNNFDTKAFDSYSLLSPGQSAAAEPDPNLTPGVTFLNYDDYNVNAQGVGGNIRPYHYKALTVRQNHKSNNQYKIKQYLFEESDYRANGVQFRFIGDFSNKNLNQNGGWSAEQTRLDASYGTSSTGEHGNDGVYNDHLAGSRHIEWYTNGQIIGVDESKRPFDQGLIDCSSTGFERSAAPADQIGAFKITNESGVTYHFSLPVYSYDEYQYSENIRNTNGLTYNEFKKPERYAYTWYLTAITGPDYVDRGGTNGEANHIVDEADWGYWVSFEYGKWTENYAWRNPDQGYHEDIDTNFKNYASGKKELYYLDAIKTKTHTAVFVKDIRVDEKSSCFAFNLQTKRDLGFVPSNYNETFVKRIYGPETNCDLFPRNYTDIQTAVAHKTYPVSALKLKKIFLFENNILKKEILEKNGLSALNSLKSAGDSYQFDINFEKHINVTKVSYVCPIGTPPNEQCGCDYYEVKEYDNKVEPTSILLHQSKNVFDTDDLRNISDDFNNAIRIIEFETDYSLAPETKNSFDHPLLYSENPPLSENEYTYYGKLTLNKLHYSGKSGEQNLLPPVSFKYDYSNPVIGSGSITGVLGNRLYKLLQDNSELEPGDLIKFTSNSKDCFALVRSKTGNVHELRILGNNLPNLGSIRWAKTKNPPYNKNHYDVWGLYKSDYNDPAERTIYRYTTPISAKSVDAWSLREINTNLGSTISVEYESDTYRKAEFHESALRVNSVEFLSLLPDDEYSAKFLLHVDGEGKDLNSIYSIGSNLSCLLPYTFVLTTSSGSTQENRFLTTGTITAVSNNTLEATIGPYESNGSSSENFYFQGSVFYNFDYENVGGGFRVKSISLNNKISGTTKQMYYDYSVNGVTSGITSYEPNIVQKITVTGGDEATNRLANLYNYARFENIFQSAREIPVPGVMYETVFIKERITRDGVTQEGLNYNQYNFWVVNKNMIGYEVNSNNVADVSDNYDGIQFSKVVKKDIALRDFTQWIGRLKSIVTFDKDGNKISEIKNEYLHEQIPDYANKRFDQVSSAYPGLLENYSDLGLIQESTWSGRFVKKGTAFQLFGIVSHRYEFPLIQTAKINTNYKTGISTRTENQEFDFYSGLILKSTYSDGYGNKYLMEITPAYKIYSGMSLASLSGKNMLTQEAQNATFKIDGSDNKIGVVGASVQTWSDQILAIEPMASYSQATPQPGIWRKVAQYSFIGDDIASLRSDGLYKINDFIEFTAWNKDDVTTSGWQKNNVITLYDVYSHALEVKDINEVYASTLMSTDQTRVFATAINTKHSEFAYSGLEEIPQEGYFSGGVTQGQGTVVQSKAHTGKSSLQLEGGQSGFGVNINKTSMHNLFRMSVWVNEENAANAKLNYLIFRKTPGGTTPVGGPTSIGFVPNNKKKSGEWYLFEVDIPVPSSSSEQYLITASLENSGLSRIWVDDFRIHPFNASMTSYVYNEWGELSHILDINNLYTEYRYDGMGRLKETYRESFKTNYGDQGVVKVSEVSYNYALNNPGLLNINTTVVGSGGMIQPYGDSKIMLNGSITYSIVSTCPANYLNSIKVDGVAVDKNGTSITLPSGTQVTVEVGVNGRLLRFTNIKSNHIVQTEFIIPDRPVGMVRCYNPYENYGTGEDCFDGSYEYAYYDECADLGPITRVFNWLSIPDDIRAGLQQSQFSCCANNGSGSTCGCVQN